MNKYDNNYGKLFPVQKIPLRKKTQEWKEACVDAIIAREGSGSLNDMTMKEKMKISYNLYNSEYDLNDLKYVTNPFQVEDGFPASPQDFNIIKPKIDLLLGEETKRPFNLKIVQTNSSAVGEVQEKYKKALIEFLMDQIKGEQDPENSINLKEVEKYMKYSFKTIAEQQAYHILGYLKEKLNFDHEFFKGFKDGLISGKEIYYTGVINGEPVLERVNPLYCDHDYSPDLEFIEDGDWFLRRFDMTASALYDRHFDKMSEHDLDRLLDLIHGESQVRTGSDVNSRSIMFREKVSDKFFKLDSESDTYNLITLYHVTWRSFQEVGFVDTEDENGELKTITVDRTYKPDPGEVIQWEWVDQIWEGYRAGEDLYFGIQPIEYQYISIDNPNAQKLPYTGIIYNNTNANNKSLVAIMKPLQYMYIALWYRIELALARDKGKILTMDITQIPKSMGIDFNRWAHYLTAMGVNIINPYDEGWDIPGREGGRPSQFNQISAQDLSMSNTIEGYLGLLAKIEDMISELSGVTKQRQGSIHNRELVGNVERSVIQSSHITEPLFWTHNQVKKRAITNLLNTAKAVWADSGKKKLHYILSDSARAFTDITDDFIYSDFDIFLTDSTKEAQNIEAARGLLQHAMQNGASMLSAVEILSSDNLTDIKLKLQQIEEDRAKREDEMARIQQETEMAKQEVLMQLEGERNRVQEEDSIRRSQTSIEVAMINAESKQEGPVEDTSELDAEKVRIQQEKQRRDAELKSRQIEEDIRKNKTAERQRQQEIEIKRRQASKPNKTN
jgi:hypothetical protein